MTTTSTSGKQLRLCQRGWRGWGQGGPYTHSPSAHPRFPSGSSAASKPVQRSSSPPDAGRPVGHAEFSGRGPGTGSGVVNLEVQCLQGPGLAWRSPCSCG